MQKLTCRWSYSKELDCLRGSIVRLQFKSHQALLEDDSSGLMHRVHVDVVVSIVYTVGYKPFASPSMHVSEKT